MHPAVKWAAVSVGTLVAVEATLIRASNCTYTSLYRSARSGPLGLVPVAAAVVVFAHLEGWIPERLDPFLWGRSWI